MDYFPDVYKEVTPGTYQQAACSPTAPSPDWSGVIIAAPERVVPASGEKPVVVVCGYFVVPVLDAQDTPAMIVRVRRTDDPDFVLSGEVVEEGENEPVEPPPADAPRASREELKGVETGGYFNVDVQRYVTIPLLPGTYDVDVSYAGKRSNTVRIEIAPP